MQLCICDGCKPLNHTTIACFQINDNLHSHSCCGSQPHTHWPTPIVGSNMLLILNCHHELNAEHLTDGCNLIINNGQAHMLPCEADLLNYFWNEWNQPLIPKISVANTNAFIMTVIMTSKVDYV